MGRPYGTPTLERVADELHDIIRSVLTAVATADGTISYEDLLDAIGRQDPGLRDRAETDLAPVLRAVSVAEDEAGRGLLTAVVVRPGSGLPGGGFFALAAERGRDVTDRQVAWHHELARVHRAHSP
jgi:hypothetical protein